MANRLIALAGPGRGPRVQVREYTRLVGRVRGLTEGTVEAEVFHEGGESSVLVFLRDEDLELPPGQSVQFNHDGPSKSLVCCVIGS